MFFFFVIVWFNLLCNLGLCLYLQAYVVTISHLDTWMVEAEELELIKIEP